MGRTTVRAADLEPLPATSCDLVVLDDALIFPLLRPVGKRILGNELENAHVPLICLHLGHLSAVRGAIVEPDDRAQLPTIQIQDNLLAVLRVFEFHPSL
jgi:hypothetical protein